MLTIDAAKAAALLAPHFVATLHDHEETLMHGLMPPGRYVVRHVLANAEDPINAARIVESFVRRALAPETLLSAAAQIQVI